MAKQIGIFKVSGTLDNTTFAATKNGNIAKVKTTLNGQRIKTDPAFKMTQENFTEFGRAAKAGKTLRNPIAPLLKPAKDSLMTSRMLKSLLAVIKSDTTNPRGQRTLQAGNVQLLKGFEFNSGAELSSILLAPYTTSIQRAAGTLTLNIPSFIPANMIKAPVGATHFKIVSAGIEADFMNEVGSSDMNSSAVLPLDQNATAALNLVNTVTANSTYTEVLVAGIQFFQHVNGVDYQIEDKAFNALSIVDILGA